MQIKFKPTAITPDCFPINLLIRLPAKGTNSLKRIENKIERRKKKRRKDFTLPPRVTEVRGMDANKMHPETHRLPCSHVIFLLILSGSTRPQPGPSPLHMDQQWLGQQKMGKEIRRKKYTKVHLPPTSRAPDRRGKKIGPTTDSLWIEIGREVKAKQKKRFRKKGV